MRTIQLNWAEFKSLVIVKKTLKYQYHLLSDYYDIWAREFNVEYQTRIPVQSGDLDLVDFEDNYKAGGNERVDWDVNIQNPVTVSGGSISDTEVRNAIGMESGTNLLIKIQNLWDKLHDLFFTGLAKVKLWDGTDTVTISSDGTKKRLDVSLGNRDTISEAMVTIDFPHHKTHEGDNFRYIEELILASTGDTKLYLIKSPNSSKSCHFLWNISGDEKLKIIYYKNPTITNNGTNMSNNIFNRNENSLNTADCIIYKNPTITNNGNLRDSAWLDKHNGHSGTEELILEKDTYYLFIIEAKHDGAYIAVNFDWYEHIDSI